MKVHIRVVEAKEIARVDTLGSTDAYCILSLNKKSQQKTSVISSMTPSWNEDFSFPITNPTSDYVHILMKDKDALQDDMMAKLDIFVSALPVGLVVDHWYPMQPLENVAKGGLIHLLIHLAPSDELPFLSHPQNPVPNVPLMLHVRLLEAKEIEKMDIIGNSDPYCVLSVSNSPPQKSKVCENSILPKWNQEFHFVVNDPERENFKILMRDKDMKADDDMSNYFFPIRFLPFQSVSDQWITMHACRNVKMGGIVHIISHLTYPDATPFAPTT